MAGCKVVVTCGDDFSCGSSGSVPTYKEIGPEHYPSPDVSGIWLITNGAHRRLIIYKLFDQPGYPMHSVNMDIPTSVLEGVSKALFINGTAVKGGMIPVAAVPEFRPIEWNDGVVYPISFTFPEAFESATIFAAIDFIVLE